MNQQELTKDEFLHLLQQDQHGEVKLIEYGYYKLYQYGVWWICLDA